MDCMKPLCYFGTSADQCGNGNLCVSPDSCVCTGLTTRVSFCSVLGLVNSKHLIFHNFYITFFIPLFLYAFKFDIQKFRTKMASATVSAWPVLWAPAFRSSCLLFQFLRVKVATNSSIAKINHTESHIHTHKTTLTYTHSLQTLSHTRNPQNNTPSQNVLCMCVK